VSDFLWRSVHRNIFLLSFFTSFVACSSDITLYVEVSRRCAIPHLMYCGVFIPTGPRFLSAGAIVITGFCFIVLRMDSWVVVRLEVGGCLTKERLTALLNWWNLVSISRGGGRGFQVDFTRRVLAVGALLVSPAKYTLRLMSRSSRERVLTCSMGVVFTWGVGMYFNPSPRSVLAIGGRIFPVVRSWNARFETGGK